MCNFQVNSDSIWPDIQVVMLAVHVAIDAGLIYRNVLNMKASYWKDNFKSLTLKEGFTCLPILHHPLSRGEVRLKSGNIDDQPAIRPNYFSNRTDIDTLIKGIKVCLQLGEAPTLKRDVGAKLFVKTDTVCGEKFKVKLHNRHHEQ